MKDNNPVTKQQLNRDKRMNKAFTLKLTDVDAYSTSSYCTSVLSDGDNHYESFGQFSILLAPVFQWYTAVS